MNLPKELSQPVERLADGKNKKWRLRFCYGLTNWKVSEDTIFSCYLYGSLDDAQDAAKTILKILLNPLTGARGDGSVFIEYVKQRRLLGIPLPNAWKATYLIDYDTEKKIIGEQPIPERW